MNTIPENIACIRTLCGNKTTLVAVSKQQPDERIVAALQAGQRVFGENRVQEALTRWAAQREQYPDLALHLIGPLQTNKVRDAVALFDVIETVDRPDLVEALQKECEKQDKWPQLFIQVNTGDEAQKSGVSVNGLDSLIDHAKKRGLDISGLMCIPPVDAPPALHFALLKKLAEQHDLKCLSMGMSGDFEKAIALGATHVRIGTGIFGARGN